MPTSLQMNLNAINTQGALANLQNAKGTLYVEGGQIKESAHPVGRAFLAVFSSKIREQNAQAVRVLSRAMERVYGIQVDPGDMKRLDGGTLTRLTGRMEAMNRQRIDSFITSVSQQYGHLANQEVQNLRQSAVYTNGTAPDGVLDAAQRNIEGAERQVLQTIGSHFRTTDMTGQQMLAELGTVPRFKELLDGTFGVALGKNMLTIGAHTSMVMDQFEDQKAHYDLPGLQERMRKQPGFENFNAERFMKAVIVFHDIGKSLCNGDNARQHEFTLPILRDTMKTMGFNEQEIRLAANLVDNDLLGEWQAGKRHDVGEVRGGLRALAQDSGVAPRDYLTMQKLFYISDASSYPPLRAAFMDTDANGKLHFTQNKTDSVIQSFDTQFGTMGEDIKTTLFSTAALAGNETYPVSLFKQDFSKKAYNVYDMSRTLVENKPQLEAAIAQMPAAMQPAARARLAQAMEMANLAIRMDADHWSSEHTQGIIVARLEIRQAGISAMLPRTLSGADGGAVYFGQLEGLSGLRGPGSPTERFYALVDAKGGSSHLIQDLGQCQVVSSWCPTSLAVKGYLNRSRAVSEEHYFMATHDQHGAVTDKPAECYDRFAHAPREYWEELNQNYAGGDGSDKYAFATVNASRAPIQQARTADTSLFDTSLRYQMAMQMEMLSNFEFPGNNPARGEVILHRVEGNGVLGMYGIDATQPGSHGVMKRSAADSASIICPVLGAGGLDATTQTVPYYRIVNSFFLGAQGTGPLAGGSLLHTDSQREIVFMSDGLDVTYQGNGNTLVHEFMDSYQPPFVPPAGNVQA